MRDEDAAAGCAAREACEQLDVTHVGHCGAARAGGGLSRARRAQRGEFGAARGLGVAALHLREALRA